MSDSAPAGRKRDDQSRGFTESSDQSCEVEVFLLFLLYM